jgi:hypothetical protein
MRARLTGGLWVKLINPVEISAAARDALDQDINEEAAWIELLSRIRTSSRSVSKERHTAQASLFAI